MFSCTLSLTMATCILEIDLNLPLDLLRYMNFWHGKTFSRLKKKSCDQCKRFQEGADVCQSSVGVSKIKTLQGWGCSLAHSAYLAHIKPWVWDPTLQLLDSHKRFTRCCQVRWRTLATSALGKLRQEDWKSEDSLGILSITVQNKKWKQSKTDVKTKQNSFHRKHSLMMMKQFWLGPGRRWDGTECT